MEAHIQEQLLETFHSTFEISTETFSKVRIGSVENLVVVILILITIQSKEEFASLFVTLKISRLLNNGENQRLDYHRNLLGTSLGALHGVSLIKNPPIFSNQVGTIVCHGFSYKTLQ